MSDSQNRSCENILAKSFHEGKNGGMSNILHNATVDTLLERRSIRKFKPKPLPDDVVETLETVAQHAASSQFLND